MEREKLLLIPGPSPVHPRIINSLSLPTISHISSILARELKEALANLKKIVFCQNGYPFIISGAGTLAMEMALLNTVRTGEKVLVLSQGYFGERMAEIARSFGLSCDVIQRPWGKVVQAGELAQKLAEENYSAVISTHVDTSTGACAPIREYARIVQDRALFIVDGVCATAGIEERMDDWGLDVILAASQKCFGCPPGLSILVLSERAMSKRRSIESIPAYYSDLLRWLPIMEDPSKYFSTPCVNDIRAFGEATKIILEEGIEERFRRHDRFARAIRAALTELGFSFFPEASYLASTLSVILYPEGLEDKAFRSVFYENGVVVAGGLGETAGRVFRMGHMGNLSQHQVLFAIEALERTLSSLGFKFKAKSGESAARAILED